MHHFAWLCTDSTSSLMRDIFGIGFFAVLGWLLVTNRKQISTYLNKQKGLTRAVAITAIGFVWFYAIGGIIYGFFALGC